MNKLQREIDGSLPADVESALSFHYVFFLQRVLRTDPDCSPTLVTGSIRGPAPSSVPGPGYLRVPAPDASVTSPRESV